MDCRFRSLCPSTQPADCTAVRKGSLHLPSEQLLARQPDSQHGGCEARELEVALTPHSLDILSARTDQPPLLQKHGAQLALPAHLPSPAPSLLRSSACTHPQDTNRTLGSCALFSCHPFLRATRHGGVKPKLAVPGGVELGGSLPGSSLAAAAPEPGTGRNPRATSAAPQAYALRSVPFAARLTSGSGSGEPSVRGSKRTLSLSFSFQTAGAPIHVSLRETYTGRAEHPCVARGERGTSEEGFPAVAADSQTVLHRTKRHHLSS